MQIKNFEEKISEKKQQHELTVSDLNAKWKKEVEDVKQISAILTSSSITDLNGQI